MTIWMFGRNFFIIVVGEYGDGVFKYLIGCHVLRSTDVFANNTMSALRAELRRAESNITVFETGDMVGLDVSCGALTAIYEESRDMCFYPPQMLRRKVKAGQLGRKTGHGWYVYEEDGSKKEA